MKKLIWALIILAGLTAGCMTNIPKPEISVHYPTTDISGIKKFYVARDDEPHAQDEKHLRGLHAVQEALIEHGFPATSGLLSAMPSDTECKVIIHDRWFWDLAWYQLSLDLQFYDAHSGVLLASGHSRRDAPTIRRSPEFMAYELVEAIFPATIGGSKH